jgi:hypothetical protein
MFEREKKTREEKAIKSAQSSRKRIHTTPVEDEAASIASPRTDFTVGKHETKQSI